MLFLSNEGIHDPAMNLALEEYALRNLPLEDSILLFYVNEPSIIIGKNQNTIEEIDREYVEANGIHVVRRLSGGGAVYHDLGNLNFSFITKDEGDSFRNFAKFTKPVTDALRRLGVDAELSGRNDILVGERKISGNAQFATKGRMYSHGTLLFDSDMERVASALRVKPMKFESKSTKSVRSRVANISEFLPEPMTMEQFRGALLREIFGTEPERVPTVNMTADDWEAVRKLADARYRSWDWNYGRSPKSNVQHAHKFPSGIVDIRLFVEEGRISSCAIYGDFFGTGDVGEAEAALTEAKYEESSLRQALEGVDVEKLLGGVSREEFIDLLLLKI
ncbi:lipoate--protein ligase [Paenibacillus antri]|uniref:lipoate--protein ligase n=1 Tax=Paenibacillus antri TaxID=2582848 RepID=A0A5R9G8J9_9BACL|nr:lipoate--protein ligase [Paenibacillus antri]TLS50686.1 lipoate--protein ligase [Paenibacillus antri]